MAIQAPVPSPTFVLGTIVHGFRGISTVPWLPSGLSNASVSKIYMQKRRKIESTHDTDKVKPTSSAICCDCAMTAEPGRAVLDYNTDNHVICWTLDMNLCHVT